MPIPALSRPVAIYNNWSAYDELSDRVELTESLALRQLDELLRLRTRGVQLDYYLMDAFWYAPEAAYRAWRKPHWPDGPDRFLGRCREHAVLPGLWLATNNCGRFAGLAPHPAWKDSLNAAGNACCMFAGGFLAHFLESMHLWYERGIRIYKFDFCDLSAVTPALAPRMLKSEIRSANTSALQTGLQTFRAAHPDCLLLAYNGFDEGTQRNTSRPPVKQIDPAWLESFDAIYCGDPRPADVPAFHFWRAKDVYSDHQTRLYHDSGLPLPRIDNAGFMIGTTGTCYHRGKEAWQGMLLLSLARAGWANHYYGNLDLLTPDDAAFFAKTQRLFYPLQQFAHTTPFGALPGTGQPYGWSSQTADGCVLTVVNPSQSVATIDLPHPATRVLFSDAGFSPRLDGATLTLGPEQLSVVAVGSFATAAHDLGTQSDVVIPTSITPLSMTTTTQEDGSIDGTIDAPAGAVVRLVLRQLEPDGGARRSSGGASPQGTPLARILRLTATQNGRPLALDLRYDKAIWSGLSWAVAETPPLPAAGAVAVTAASTDLSGARLTLEAYQVTYH